MEDMGFLRQMSLMVSSKLNDKEIKSVCLKEARIGLYEPKKLKDVEILEKRYSTLPNTIEVLFKRK